jgi:hypothetical protein
VTAGELLIALSMRISIDRTFSDATDQRAARKQKAHEREFVGLILIRGRPCGIRTCDQRIKSACSSRYCTVFRSDIVAVASETSLLRRIHRQMLTFR